MGRDRELIRPPLGSLVVKALTYLDYCDSRVGWQTRSNSVPSCLPVPSQSTANSAGWETFQCRAPYLGLKSRLQGAHMTSLSRNARIAGLLYLTLLTAPLRLIYIPSKLFVAGNAAQQTTILPRTRRFSASASSAICSPRPWLSFSHWPFTRCSREWTRAWLGWW